MPYIITTHFTEADECDTSVAAATAEEARELARIAVEAAHRETGQSYDRTWEGWAATDLYIDESGGTIGPLPDGTVIEVRPISWDELADRCDSPRLYDMRAALDPEAELLDDFNAHNAR